MCVVCGCGGSDGVIDGADRPAAVAQPQDLHYGTGPAGVSIPGLSQTRTITLEADVLGANQQLADRNRAHFQAHGVRALNLLSSPGSGKTTLLCATIQALRHRAPHLPLAVIEGDQQTRLDAERIRAAGAPAIQVNTGRGCHLDAQMSVTEGADKPLKYPDMFAAASLLLINKTDLLPHVDFDLAQCIAFARQVNPGLQVLELSATRGTGMDAWLDWLLQAPSRPAQLPSADPEDAAALRARIAALEAQLAALQGQP